VLAHVGPLVSETSVLIGPAWPTRFAVIEEETFVLADTSKLTEPGPLAAWVEEAVPMTDSSMLGGAGRQATM
jgi:hypothetical protein